MNREESYNFLVNNRVELDSSVLKTKKRLIVDKIKNINNNLDFTDWLNDELPLYVAPIHNMYNCRLVVQPTNSGQLEIYIDKDFYNNLEKRDVIIHQLTHELLHTACAIRKKNGIAQYFFHNWYDDEDLTGEEFLYKGINEATTQMFTDDFENYQLSKEEDSILYFIKNIMRILKIAIGEDKLLMQYLNYNNEFEDIFNSVSDDQFIDFAINMNKIYKSNFLDSRNQKELEEIQKLEKSVLLITQKIINNQIKNNPDLKEKLEKEFSDNDFYNDMKNELFKNVNLDSIIYKKFLAVRDKATIISQIVRNKKLSRLKQQYDKKSKGGITFE